MFVPFPAQGEIPVQPRGASGDVAEFEIGYEHLAALGGLPDTSAISLPP